jgi:hypothetical protein
MKNYSSLCLGLGIAVIAMPGVARAGVFNGSFESWDLLGWSLHSDTGTIATEPFQRAAGAARTVGSWGEDLGLNPVMMPQTGYRFLRMNTRGAANFPGNDTYDTYVSQTFTLNQGEILSGWSLFYDGDSEPLDSAWVRILDQDGGLIGAPWLETSGSSAGVLAIAPAPSEWTLWQWAAPLSGNYTLQLGMTTSGANNAASFGFFDGIAVQATAVPEPTVMSLAVLSGLALLTLRHRVR